MAFKIIIGDKGKSWKLETEVESIIGKAIGDKIDGKEIKPELDGYELEIMGGSDLSGFPMYSKQEGLGLRSVLLSKGWGMHDKRSGVRRRKSIRGKIVSDKIVQLNLKAVKYGTKKLEDIFPEQNQPKAESKANEKPVESAPVA